MDKPSHHDILELMFEELERHDTNMRNHSEFVTSFLYGEGLSLKEMPDERELYADLVEAGYAPKEATKAVIKELRKLGLGG